MTVEELFPVTTLVCGLSSYCNSALFDKLLTLQNELNAANGVAPTSTAAAAAATGPAGEPALQDQPRIQLSTFLHFHAREIEKFDLPTRFFRLLRTNEPPPAAATAAGAVAGTTAAAIASPASSSSSSSAPAASSSSSSSAGVPRKYLTRDDFKPIVQEIVNRHPGLEFLESTPEFQLKYAQTVIARIFYMVNRMGNEQLTLRELRTSNFLLMLALLDQEDDINKLNDYFSYEHFYVVYCKFWELDEDHDGYIDAHDLIQYDDYALTQRVVDRIMAGAGRKLLSPIPGKMNYLDFVIFLISEVDKNNDVALEYWFNVIDLDCDGLLTTFEIEWFFEEQKQRIQSLSQELITFPDIMCQLIDMVKRPLLLLDQANKPATSARGGSQGAPGYNYPHSTSSEAGPPRLKAKEKHGSGHYFPSLPHAALSSGGIAAGSSSLSSSSSSLSSSSSALPSSSSSSTLQASTFHSHHRPFVSSAQHTPVQGGAVYNVSEGVFYKRDLRDSHMAAQFFNTLFNLNKFVQSEQRDPIRIKQIHDTPQLSDWDRYAISGYYRLAELPEAADAAQAWADMADGGEEEVHTADGQMQQQQQQQQQNMDVDQKKS